MGAAYPLPVVGNTDRIITNSHGGGIETSPEVDTVIGDIRVLPGLVSGNVVLLEIKPG